MRDGEELSAMAPRGPGQYCTKVKVPVGLATHLEMSTACGHASPSAALPPSMESHVLLLLCSWTWVSRWAGCVVLLIWLSVPGHCGAQNQAERVRQA